MNAIISENIVVNAIISESIAVNAISNILSEEGIIVLFGLDNNGQEGEIILIVRSD